MKNNQKALIVSIGLVALGVYLLFNKTPQPAKSKNNTQAYKPDWNKVLKKGSEGLEVKALQKALKQLTADGSFGEKTEARLKKVMNVTETSVNKYNEFINKK